VFNDGATATEPTFSQAVEVEPNDTCPTAQDLGAVVRPFTIAGGLGAFPNNTEDVDFFSVTVSPGESVTIDYEGQSTGAGTLVDPVLEVYDSACNWIAGSDFGGDGLNARVRVTVPPDGVLVLGAKQCCDFIEPPPTGGTYRLTVQGVSDRFDCGTCGSGAGVVYRVPTPMVLGDGSRISVQVDVVDAEGNRLSKAFSGAEALIVR